MKRGLLVVLFGPSGAGKDVLLREALPNIPGLNRCISATTRPPRPGELPGKDHLYVSEERFTRMIESGDFLEHTRYVGHGYGTPKAWVEDMLASGRDVVLRVEVQGALQLRKLAPEAPSVFLAPPSWDELRRRLEARHTDASESIEERLRVARQEVWEAEHGNGGRPMYDYLIVNDDLKEASRRFEAIVAAERCRAGRADLSYLED